MKKEIMSGRNKKRKERGRERRSPNAKHNKKVTNFMTKLSIGSVIALVVVFAAYLYNRHQLSSHLEATLSGLLQVEASASVPAGLRVAVGLGSCRDIVVQSKEVIYDRPPQEPEHFHSIASREQFLKVFAYFYQAGAAAERYISNITFFNELVDAAERAKSARHLVGGNAPIMAKRFQKEGCQVLLGAQMSSAHQSHFPEGIQVSGPIIKEDDIHLLLEYPSGQKWGPYVAPRANRFIVHEDHQNAELLSLDLFAKQAAEFNPQLLVIGGLQMMDIVTMSDEEYDQSDYSAKQKQHLLKVQKLMKSYSSGVRVHFEMASYSDEHLMKNIVQHIIPYADSLGMNEQELVILNHLFAYGKINFVSESRPRVAVILDQMRELYTFLRKHHELSHGRRLTRLHLHTLAFQAFMVEKNSPWKNTKAAAAKSSLTANRHTCGSDNIDVSKAKLLLDESFAISAEKNAPRMHLNETNPVACWEEDSFEVCVAPVLVCTDVLQTGGGGDNISSAGLVLQV